jgi:release factor glutamine methyltransferase
MRSVVDVLRDATEQLVSSGSDSPHLEARLLAQKALDRSRVWLYQNPNASVDGESTSRLQTLLKRRLDGEPVAYLIGTREFYGRTFAVDSRVLIPRPETETLLEHALNFVVASGQTGARHAPVEQIAPAGGDGFLLRDDTPDLTIVDVGTGSGILGISLALEIPSARVLMIDRSTEALDVARINCQLHGVDGRVELLQGDLLRGVDGPVDVIVANLPYIPTAEIGDLQPEVQHEPRLALDGGADGLDLYRRLFEQAAGVLSAGGGLFVEIGDWQGPAALDLARVRFGSHDVRIHPDLEGRDRVVSVTPLVE